MHMEQADRSTGAKRPMQGVRSVLPMSLGKRLLLLICAAIASASAERDS